MSVALHEPTTLAEFLLWEEHQPSRFEFDGRHPIAMTDGTIRDEYEDLIDARDHALAMAAHARGDDPGLTDAEMDAYLAAPTPLAYWRKRRALTQAALAAAAGISQLYLAQLERGRRASAGSRTWWRRPSDMAQSPCG